MGGPRKWWSFASSMGLDKNTDAWALRWTSLTCVFRGEAQAIVFSTGFPGEASDQTFWNRQMRGPARLGKAPSSSCQGWFTTRLLCAGSGVQVGAVESSATCPSDWGEGLGWGWGLLILNHLGSENILEMLSGGGGGEDPDGMWGGAIADTPNPFVPLILNSVHWRRLGLARLTSVMALLPCQALLQVPMMCVRLKSKSSM